MYAESTRVECITHPFHRQQVLRVRCGTMATPINPNHNVSRVTAIERRRVQYAARLSGPPLTRTSEERDAAALARAASSAARRVEALQVPLPCTQRHLATPDAQHPTFECPAVLPKIHEVLRAVDLAAQTDEDLYHLIRSANGEDVLWASLGAFPFQNVLNTHCAYATLRAVAAPAWALQYKSMYT